MKRGSIKGVIHFHETIFNDEMTNLTVMHNGHHHSAVAHSSHCGHHAVLQVSITLPLSNAKACREERSQRNSRFYIICVTHRVPVYVQASWSHVAFLMI